MSTTENNAAKWLGKQVRDMITGYEGICMGYVQYTSGCDNIGIKPSELKEDGSPASMLYFDDMTCEITEEFPEASKWYWKPLQKATPAPSGGSEVVTGQPEPKPATEPIPPPPRPPGGPRENPPG